MRLKSFFLIFALLVLPSLAASNAPKPEKTVFNYSLVNSAGKETSLSAYKGKVLLIVNLASQSIYSSQISALAELQKQYAEKGLIILGIPSSDFGSQELTDNAAILHYYTEAQHVTFPVFAKASVRGKDAIPLVKFLTDPKDGTSGGEIHWNFTKFLVDREGHPVMRFEVDSDPLDPAFRAKLEDVLNGSFKKHKPVPTEQNSSPDAGDDDDRE